LYIHESGQYYARKKIKGKIHREALEPHDFQLAMNTDLALRAAPALWRANKGLEFADDPL